MFASRPKVLTSAQFDGRSPRNRRAQSGVSRALLYRQRGSTAGFSGFLPWDGTNNGLGNYQIRPIFVGLQSSDALYLLA
jgi:hypothetical protein